MGCDCGIQVILLLCGKILNVECVCFDWMLFSQEIGNFVMVLGIGIGWDEFNLFKLCYYKIVIMIDVDVDGVYIWMLLLMFFFC